MFQHCICLQPLYRSSFVIIQDAFFLNSNSRMQKWITFIKLNWIHVDLHVLDFFNSTLNSNGIHLFSFLLGSNSQMI